MRVITKVAVIFSLASLAASLAFAGTWSDNFDRVVLGAAWRGDTDNFTMLDGALHGRNAHPVQLISLRWVEAGENWGDYVVQCRINVVLPNLLVCTKGALVLRRSGGEGYVFALHTVTKSVEVYRLSDESMLLSKDLGLEMEKWYLVRAELQGDEMSFYVNDELVGKIVDKRSASGAVGLAVQDALTVLFDDFTITGPGIDPETMAVSVKTTLPVMWGYIKKGKL